MRRLGVMNNDEVFDAETVKTKMIMVISQLVYTIITLLPVPLLYTSYVFSVVYFSLILGWSVYLGAGSYLQDFSERYHLDKRKTS